VTHDFRRACVLVALVVSACGGGGAGRPAGVGAPSTQEPASVDEGRLVGTRILSGALSYWASDAANAYWSRGEQLLATSFADGKERRIHPGPMGVVHVAPELGLAYATRAKDDGSLSLVGVTLDAGEVSVLLDFPPGAGGLQAFFADARGVLLALRVGDETRIVSVVAGGAPPKTLADDGDVVTGLAAGADDVFWMAGEGRTSVHRVPRSGGESMVLATVDGSASDLALRDGQLYFATSQLLGMAASGGAPTPVPCGKDASAFALAPEGIYVARDSAIDLVRGERCIRRVDAAGTIRGLAIAPGALVWTTSASPTHSEVWRALRP
jgi:hypothetical protein